MSKRKNNYSVVSYQRHLKKALEKNPDPTVSTSKEELILGMALNHPDFIFKIDERMFGTEETYTLFQEIKELDKTTKAELLLAIRHTSFFEYAIALQSNFDSEHISSFDKTLLFLEDLRLKRLELLCSSAKVENIESNDFVFEVNKFYEKESVSILDNDYQSIKDIAAFTENGLLDGTIGQGFKTGIDPIDNIIEGITMDDVIIIGARPAIGKTTFTVDLVKHMAKRNPTMPILFNSLEVPKWRLITKFISSLSGIPEWEIKSNLRNCILSDGFQRAKETLGKMPIEIIEGAYTPRQLEKEIKLINARRKSRGEEPIRIVVQDYIQIKESGKDLLTKQEVDYVLKEELKMAKKYQFIPIYLSQINRVSEARGGTKKPSMADLKDTGNLEQAGRKILLLHRAEYYGQMEDEDGNSLVNTMDVIVAKNSNGRTGHVLLKDIRLDCNIIHSNDTFGFEHVENPQNNGFPKVDPEDFLPF